MKSCLVIASVCLFTLSPLILNSGCASKGKTNDMLQYIDQSICMVSNNNRMWQVERAGKFSTLQEAEQYAANLNLGGHNDWRLPTRAELFDLHYIFFWKKNGECDMKTTGDYWTVPDEKKAPLGHWETYYVCAPEFKFYESLGTKGYVRAVRP